MSAPTEGLGALLPCPFCGGEAMVRTVRSGEDSVDTWAECTNCFASTDRYEGAYGEPEAARNMWNDRFDVPVRTALQASPAGRETPAKCGSCGELCAWCNTCGEACPVCGRARETEEVTETREELERLARDIEGLKRTPSGFRHPVARSITRVANILRALRGRETGTRIEGTTWLDGDAFCSVNGEHGEKPCEGQRSYVFVPECEHEAADDTALSPDMHRATLILHASPEPASPPDGEVGGAS